MKKKSIIRGFLLTVMIAGLASCELDMPKQTNSSFETMTITVAATATPYMPTPAAMPMAEVTHRPAAS